MVLQGYNETLSQTFHVSEGNMKKKSTFSESLHLYTQKTGHIDVIKTISLLS